VKLFSRPAAKGGAISFRASVHLPRPPIAILGVLLASLAMGVPVALPVRAAQSAQEVAGPVGAEANPQLFATLSALYAVGLDSGKTSSDADPLFIDVRSQLLAAHGPATDALRQYYRDHVLSDPAATMSRYVTFALVVGPPPKFTLPPNRMALPPDVLALDGFSQILANFYQEAQIERLWRQVQPAYEKDALLLRQPLGRIVLTGTGYLRELVRPNTGMFTVYVEPFVGGQTQFRNAGNQYSIVVDPKLDAANSFDLMRHAFLHFLLDPLPIRYQQQIMVDQPLFLIGAGAPNMPLEFRDDYSAFFTECLVRSVELKLRRLPPDQLAQEVNRAEGDGFVLIRPMLAALAKFEVSDPPMSQYFPDLVRSIDVATERRRLQTVAFAPASAGQETEDAHGQVRRGPANPLSPVDAALAEGERQIAAQNAPAAAAAFQRALTIQPGQPRALYGLAVASLLQGNATHARELFEQVVEGAPGIPGVGDPAAHSDPVALAWSHVYLGRMHDLDGDRDQALADYRAALAVSGLPEEARSAAQRGIEQAYQLAAPSRSPG
jgi:hypothetical protein